MLAKSFWKFFFGEHAAVFPSCIRENYPTKFHGRSDRCADQKNSVDVTKCAKNKKQNVDGKAFSLLLKPEKTKCKIIYNGAISSLHLFQVSIPSPIRRLLDFSQKA